MGTAGGFQTDREYLLPADAVPRTPTGIVTQQLGYYIWGMPHKDPAVRKAYTKRYRKDNRERVATWNRRGKLKRLYALSPEQYVQMLIDQAGLCELCEKQMVGSHEPSIDHDHETGLARALLCRSCNVGLHYVESHKGFFVAAERYLEKFPRW